MPVVWGLSRYKAFPVEKSKSLFSYVSHRKGYPNTYQPDKGCSLPSSFLCLCKTVRVRFSDPNKTTVLYIFRMGSLLTNSSSASNSVLQCST